MPGRNVVWTPEARNTYFNILSYVRDSWGIQVAKKLDDKVEQVLQVIQSYPFSFPASETAKQVRKSVLTPQTSLFYQVKGEEVILLYFWDNRSNPENRPR